MEWQRICLNGFFMSHQHNMAIGARIVKYDSVWPKFNALPGTLECSKEQDMRAGLPNKKGTPKVRGRTATRARDGHQSKCESKNCCSSIEKYCSQKTLIYYYAFMS